MSQFAVIGLGRFGFHVTQALHEAGHEVLAIDANSAAVQRVKDHATQAVVLDASDKRRLLALGVKDCDVVIVSLGERLDVSALVALHLKEIGVKRVIAKAGSEDHAKLLELLGVHEVIFPERQSAQRLANRLRDANVLDYIPLGEGYSIHEITPPDAFLDKSLQELRLRNEYGVQVLAIRDSRTDHLQVNPPADYRIGSADVVVLLGSDQQLDRLRAMKRT